TALCEASVALLWEARPLPDRVAEGPRRFAEALRTGRPPGRLSAPDTGSPARGAFDRALLDAAVVFARTEPVDAAGADGGPAVISGAVRPDEREPGPEPVLMAPRTRPVRSMFGPAGRDYGLRVGLCIAVSAAVALALRAEHWYWLPATATFLVKPDLGPLFSRTVNRFAGTVAGVLVFAAAGALLDGWWWPALIAGAGGALLPFATRHFALQTVAITLMVLSFVHVSGDPQAALERIVDTSAACALVLVVGHLPRLADPRRRVGHRVTAALRATETYLGEVLRTEPGHDRGERLVRRRAAYRALGEARAAAETAAAELVAARGRNPDWLTVVTAAERIVDAATACAVRLDHGARRPTPQEARRLCEALTAMADALEDPGRPGPPALAAQIPPVPGCATLTDVAAELEHLRGFAGAA
ncbi:FUSC family protein, partial [Streptomyces rimosus]|uniref:FUSC family protein n=1 Tax=Streptomyces rimosus TaxID=1927 RepID=UPI000517C013